MQLYLLGAVVLVSGLGLMLSIYLVGKIKWIIATQERHKRAADRQQRQLFRQIQIAEALNDELGLSHRLPPMGGKAGSPDFLKAVADHVLTARPVTAVECGSGISTVVIARCMQLSGAGHVFSLEHLPEFAAATRAILKRHGLEEWATVIDAPLIAQADGGQWYEAEALPGGEIDLLIVDGPPARTGKSPRYPAGPRLFSRLAPSGAIFIDDAKRPEERAVIERWRGQFPNLKVEIDVDDFEKGIAVARRA